MSVTYRDIARQLREEIETGLVGVGGRLPGEAELAARFGVGRGTVRRALASLEDVGLVRPQMGSGSFVSYDGEVLDESLGWAEALAQQGVRTSSRLITLVRAAQPVVAADLGLPSSEFLLVERVRVLEADGSTISLERSRVPWQEPFEAVLVDGLVDDSLQTTLVHHGLWAHHGRESIGLALLGPRDAELLSRRTGEPFLDSERTTFDLQGRVVEHVSSLLHPDHFRLEHSFGGAT